jgi:hypothetical protein
MSEVFLELSVKGLQCANVLFDYFELLPHAIKVINSAHQFLPQPGIRHNNIMGLQSDLLHALHVRIDDLLLSLPLLLEFFDFRNLLKALCILLLFFLNNSDALIELSQ